MIAQLMSALRRARAIFRVRRLEITLQGQNDTLPGITCPESRAAILKARQATQAELAQARAAYIALLPVGQRRTWELA